MQFCPNIHHTFLHVEQSFSVVFTPRRPIARYSCICRVTRTFVLVAFTHNALLLRFLSCAWFTQSQPGPIGGPEAAPQIHVRDPLDLPNSFSVQISLSLVEWGCRRCAFKITQKEPAETRQPVSSFVHRQNFGASREDSR